LFHGNFDLLIVHGVLIDREIKGQVRDCFSIGQRSCGLTGISSISNMYAGTCRMLSALRIAFRISASSFAVNGYLEVPSGLTFILKKRRTLSLSSFRLPIRRWPMHSESSTTSEKRSRTEYISDDPKRTPEGLRTPSLSRSSVRFCIVYAVKNSPPTQDNEPFRLRVLHDKVALSPHTYSDV
jgi:hypothetical protein